MSPDLDDQCLLMYQEARRLSAEFGHFEIICTLHVVIVLLTSIRAENLDVLAPDVEWLKAVVSSKYPPWPTDIVVLSPAGKTPKVLRLQERALEMARSLNQNVHVEHFWTAILELESEWVASFLSELRIVP